MSRPTVDFSKLSWGSIKRYEALYGVRCPHDDLRSSVSEHFAMRVYNMMRSDLGDLPKVSDSELTCDIDTFKTENKTPHEIIEGFLRIKPD